MKSGPAQHSRALLMLLLANLFWGLSFPVIKAILLLHDAMLPGVDSWFSTLYTVGPRFLFAVVILTVWLACRRRAGASGLRVTPREWRQGLTLGLFAAGGMLLQNDGLQYTHASTSAFLTQVSAFLIPLWVAGRTRRNPGALVWICCVLVLAGVAILGRFNWQTLEFGRGEWETLASALFFMGQILALDRPEFAGNRPLSVTWVMFIIETVVYWALIFAVAPDFSVVLKPFTSPAWLGFTATLTLFCTLGAFILMNAWQPKITATEAGLLYCIEPIFASVMVLFLPGWFSIWAGIAYPNETATWTLLVGGALITLANVLLQLRPPSKQETG